MATVVMFHHAQEQTRGFLDFAEDLREAGHAVHTPDLNEGCTFDEPDDGAAYAEEVLFHACVPPDEFGAPWPDGVPAQIHAMEADPSFTKKGTSRLPARSSSRPRMPSSTSTPGNEHLFADPSLASHDADAADLLTTRVLGFLGRL